jgi:lipopolysaccharide transport system permease protein
VITLITPPRRFALPSVRELFEAREVAYRFGTRDILLRYRQTVVGVAWVVIQPLLGAGIFALVFGRVADLPSDGVPYFLFTFMGMLVFTLFSNLVSRSAPSLVSNQALVSKVFFPRMLVPLATSMSVLLDFAVGLALGGVLLVVYGVNPGWAALLTPVWLLEVLMLGLGIGVAASAIMVPYRDVAYVVPWLLQVALYASPVAYSLSAIPADLQWLYQLNPLTWMLEEFRWSLLGQHAPEPWQVVASALVPLLVLVAGALVFQQQERKFADVI